MYYIKKNYKYIAKLHVNTNSADPRYIGNVRANSIKELKIKARKHARYWNQHLFGRIHVEDADHGLEFFINP